MIEIFLYPLQGQDNLSFCPEMSILKSNPRPSVAAALLRISEVHDMVFTLGRPLLLC
jgi:hypothetical protein